MTTLRSAATCGRSSSPSDRAPPDAPRSSLWNLEESPAHLSGRPDELWKELSGEGESAWRALLALERIPTQAVALVRKHVRTGESISLPGAGIASLIAHLDDDLAVR